MPLHTASAPTTDRYPVDGVPVCRSGTNVPGPVGTLPRIADRPGVPVLVTTSPATPAQRRWLTAVYSGSPRT